MRAVVVHGARDLRVEERAVPSPGPGEVLLAMAYGGICGSDLHYYQSLANGTFAVREPLVLGHEVVGRVAEDPEGLVAAGTPVAVHPAGWCGSCPECAAGWRHVCRNSSYLGSASTDPHTQGGFAERLVVRREQLRPLPDGLPLERAVLAEPLGVALHALARAGEVTGRRVLVSGAGPIGVLVAGAAKEAGAAEVWSTDLHDAPLRIAAAAGADRTVRVGAMEVPSGAFDVVLEASGAPAAVGAALDAVRRRGVVVQVGQLPGGPIGASLAAITGKEADYRGTMRFDTEIDEAIALLAASERFDAAVTHTFALGDAEQAMATAADASRSGKVVLRLDS